MLPRQLLPQTSSGSNQTSSVYPISLCNANNRITKPNQESSQSHPTTPCHPEAVHPTMCMERPADQSPLSWKAFTSISPRQMISHKPYHQSQRHAVSKPKTRTISLRSLHRCHLRKLDQTDMRTTISRQCWRTFDRKLTTFCKRPDSRCRPMLDSTPTMGPRTWT